MRSSRTWGIWLPSWCVLAALSGWACPRPVAVERPLLEAPDLTAAGMTPVVDGPLAPVLQAYQQGDCPLMLQLSLELMDSIRGEVTERFHPESRQGVPAVELREVLTRYLHGSPPLVEMGTNGFEFSRSWMEAVAFCLVQQDRLEEAANIYLDLCRDRPEAATLWPLTLVYGWSGQRESALQILRSWPEDQPVPLGYAEVLERLERGEAIPQRLP
ncbi:MAG: hypothetical protein JW797_18215 [Bradymonadales bacterium]|nr:hypothetical protein [Bradymonadales bacterium]